MSFNCTGDEIILATGRNLKCLNWERSSEPQKKTCCRHWQDLSGISVRGRKIFVIWIAKSAVIRWLLVQIIS